MNGLGQLTVGNQDVLSVTLTVPSGQMISAPSTLYITGCVQIADPRFPSFEDSVFTLS